MKMQITMQNNTQTQTRVLLISIKPCYIEKILDGNKTIELRKTKPKLKPDDFILVYASSPKQSIIGWLKVKKIIDDTPRKLWSQVKKQAGVTKKEFDSYYKNSKLAVAICFDLKYKTDLSLNTVRQKWENFNPPQSFHYLRSEEVCLAESITGYSVFEKTENLSPECE